VGPAIPFRGSAVAHHTCTEEDRLAFMEWGLGLVEDFFGVVEQEQVELTVLLIRIRVPLLLLMPPPLTSLAVLLLTVLLVSVSVPSSL